MRRFVGDEGEVAFDDAHWPFVFIKWWGTPNIDLVDRYFDAQEEAAERARREGVRMVVVSDALEVKNPPATVRKRIGERTAAMGDISVVNLKSYVVLSNPMVRGALTAIQWFTRDAFEVEYVATCAQAIERGLVVLGEIGQDPPAGLGPDAYRPPDRTAVGSD